MHEACLLESDCEEDPTRGSRFWLRADLIERAESEAAHGQPRGRILADQTIFLVEAISLIDLANALQDSSLTRSVLWVAELGTGASFLLVLDRRHTSTTAHTRLRVAIESSGASVDAGI
jgi:hypothetical protein